MKSSKNKSKVKIIAPISILCYLLLIIWIIYLLSSNNKIKKERKKLQIKIIEDNCNSSSKTEEIENLKKLKEKELENIYYEMGLLKVENEKLKKEISCKEENELEEIVALKKEIRSKQGKIEDLNKIIARLEEDIAKALLN